jgi:NADH-quinone oxidoreductase subunit N
VTTADFTAIAPMIALGATLVVALLMAGFVRRHAPVAAVSIAGLVVSLGLLPAAARSPRHVTSLLVVDRYAIVYSALILGATLATAVLCAGYLARRMQARREEFYVVLLLAALGGLVLAASDHFASLFLGLETLSVALYAMIAYVRTDRGALEAGIKYLVLAGASSAFLLFGMALLYNEAGTLALSVLSGMLADAGGVTVVVGAALVFAGLAFKLAVVPFHMWTPDVYDGAPAPVTGFLATVSKSAVFAAVLRLFSGLPAEVWHTVVPAFVVVAAASMAVGNLLALLQIYVKRILAYSSIAHMGYLLVAFVAAGSGGPAAATFYLVAYTVTTLVAFGAIGAIAGRDGEPETLDDFRGMFWRRPALASALAISLFSLAGIPLTAGFLGKIFVISAGVGAGEWLLLAFLVVNSAIGLYYYLRVVVAMFTGAEAETAATGLRVGWTAGVALFVLVVLLFWIGVFPSQLVDWISVSTAALQ